MAAHDELATRASLLLRLRNWSDEKSWCEFFDTYWRLIYGAARKAGLTDAEAQDVVQETIITVSKKIGEFDYDRARGSFKGWLLNITRWRIADQFRKRLPAERPPRPPDEGRATTWIERVPDPESLELEKFWELEWRKTLLDAALERVRPKVSAEEFEMFELYAMKSQPAQKVAEKLGVATADVYNAKHKLTGLMAKEVKRLEMRLM